MSTNKGLDETGVRQFASDIKTLADATYPANNAIASAYDASSSYIVGEYCLRNGLFYKCNTAIGSSGEAWTAAHWDQVDVATELVLMSKITYTNMVVHQTSFLLNGTYEDYPYRASIPLAGVTVETIPEVVFSVGDVQSSIFAPVAHTYNGGIYIYANDVPYGTLEGELDTETFLAQVTGSGIMTFTYINSWNIDPSTYGITLTGIPNSGDSIEVTYNTSESAAMMEILGSIVIPTIICWNATGPNPVPEPGEFDIYGLPAGGTAGQVLTKVSSTDFNAEWVDPPGKNKGMTLLWENTNLDQTFTSMTIEVNHLGYDYLFFDVKLWTTNEYYTSFMLRNGERGGSCLVTCGGSYGSAASNLTINRLIDLTNSSTIIIGELYTSSNGASFARRTNNDAFIPARIYGVNI